MEARIAQIPKLIVRRVDPLRRPAWYLSRAERRELAGQRPYLLTELLTRLAGTGRRPETPTTTTSRSGRSARRAETPEMPKTHVVWLITQRSQVQILPPLPGKTAPEPLLRGRFCCDANEIGAILPDIRTAQASSERRMRPGTGRCLRRSGPPSLAADDAFRQDVHDRVSLGCPMILAGSVQARRGGETNAWT